MALVLIPREVDLRRYPYRYRETGRRNIVMSACKLFALLIMWRILILWSAIMASESSSC